MFCSSRDGEIGRIERKMDGVKYKGILEQNLFQSACDLRLGWRFTFKQNNDTKRSAKATHERFKEKKSNVLKWPNG